MNPVDYNACLTDIGALPGSRSTGVMLAHLASHPEWNFLGCLDLAELRVITELVRRRGTDVVFFLKSLIECQECSKASCSCGTTPTPVTPTPVQVTCPPGTQMVDQEAGDGTVICRPIPVVVKCPDGSAPVDGKCPDTVPVVTECSTVPHEKVVYNGGPTDV